MRAALSGAGGAGSSSPAEPLLPASAAARVDAIFASLDRSDAPGCAVAAMRAGEIVFQRGYGMADLEHGVAITPRTRFYIASLSKQFTAFTILLLAREGKLSLDDDVRKYVREVPDFGRTISLRRLLTHTSGLRDQWNLFNMAGWRSSDIETEQDVLDLVRRQRALNFPPGEEFLYNNTGYTLLAVVVKRVSGQSLPAFAAERIFKPLGMDHTAYLDDYFEVVPDRAAGYWGAGPNGRFRIAQPPNAYVGPTGVVTTLDDLARWDRNFYHPVAGDGATISQMTTPGRLDDGTEIGYGFGLFSGQYRGLQMTHHAGADPGFRAELLRFPEARFSVAVLCNSFEIFPTPLAQQVADVVLSGEIARAEPQAAHDAVSPQEVSVPSEELNRYAGLYWNARTAQTRRFFCEHGKLLLDGGGEGKFELRPLGGGSFQLPVAPRRYVFAFSTAQAGARGRLRESIAGQKPLDYRMVPSAGEHSAGFAGFSGEYYSPELDVAWRIELRDGKLWLRRRRFDDAVLSPILSDVFQAGPFTLEFRRGRGGRITALDVTTERVRHVQFLRRATTDLDRR